MQNWKGQRSKRRATQHKYPRYVRRDPPHPSTESVRKASKPIDRELCRAIAYTVDTFLPLQRLVVGGRHTPPVVTGWVKQERKRESECDWVRSVCACAYACACAFGSDGTARRRTMSRGQQRTQNTRESTAPLSKD